MAYIIQTLTSNLHLKLMSAVFTCVGHRPGWQWCELQHLVTDEIHAVFRNYAIFICYAN